jgi:predicted transcriptional regulator
MLTGRIQKEEGVWWSAESPIAGVHTQGRSRKDAMAMLADAFESLVNRPGFKVAVTEHGPGGEVLVETNEPAALAAYVLRYQRETHGLSLADVAKKLGSSSKNAYARYERGTSTPTIDKFAELLHAVAPELAVVIDTRALQPRRAGERPSRARTAVPEKG